MEHTRRIQLHIIELCGIYNPFFILFLYNQLLLHLEIHKVLFDMLGSNMQKL